MSLWACGCSGSGEEGAHPLMWVSMRDIWERGDRRRSDEAMRRRGDQATERPGCQATGRRSDGATGRQGDGATGRQGCVCADVSFREVMLSRPSILVATGLRFIHTSDDGYTLQGFVEVVASSSPLPNPLPRFQCRHSYFGRGLVNRTATQHGSKK